MLRMAAVQNSATRLSYWQLWPVRPHRQESGTSHAMRPLDPTVPIHWRSRQNIYKRIEIHWNCNSNSLKLVDNRWSKSLVLCWAKYPIQSDRLPDPVKGCHRINSYPHPSVAQKPLCLDPNFSLNQGLSETWHLWHGRRGQGIEEEITGPLTMRYRTLQSLSDWKRCVS